MSDQVSDLYGPVPAAPLQQPKSAPLQRNWYGYAQYRESEIDPWHFVVTGFDETTSGQDGFCSVLLVDGERNRVPIDAQDRILIRGRRYGRDKWVH